MGYIYLITNKITKKKYVGQSVQKDINSRWKQHKCMISSSIGKYLLDSYKKHGIHNFKFQIICICFDEDVDDLEKHYIEKYNTLAPNGYNLTIGGKRRYLKKESKDKISKALSGRGGNPCSEETKQKISLANRGNKNGNFGKKMSDEQRKKISETMKKQKRLPTEKQLNALRQYNQSHNKRRVGKYDKNGVLLETYESSCEAARKNKLHFGSIGKVCRNVPHQKTAGGFIWKYID
jgi:group I intron endonuclease